MVKCNETNFVTVLNAFENRFFENLAFFYSVTMKYHLQCINTKYFEIKGKIPLIQLLWSWNKIKRLSAQMKIRQLMTLVGSTCG